MPQFNEPDISQKRAFVQQEFQRRSAGQPASTAGIGQGADVMAQRAGVGNLPLGEETPTVEAPGVPQGVSEAGAEGFPFAGAVGQLKQEKGESQTLVNALIFRLKKLTERGE